MRNLFPLPAALRDRIALAVLVPAVVALAVLSAAGTSAQAVANRFIDKVGASDLGGGGLEFGLGSLLKKVLQPAGGAGLGEISTLITAMISLVLLGAIVYFVFGILKTVSGRRGGVEPILTVVFALIVGIAGLEVLA